MEVPLYSLNTCMYMYMYVYLQIGLEPGVREYQLTNLSQADLGNNA